MADGAVWNLRILHDIIIFKMVKKIILTGGTFAGKSIILNLFKKYGYQVIPDNGFEVLTDLTEQLGLEGQKSFRKYKPVQFYKQILRRQLEREAAAIDGVVILDRGVYDYAAMMKLEGVAKPQSIDRLISQATSYTKVFVLDTLSDFNARANSGRCFDRDDSIRLNKLVSDLYTELGCDVIRVKEMPLQERYEFIKAHL